MGKHQAVIKPAKKEIYFEKPDMLQQELLESTPACVELLNFLDQVGILQSKKITEFQDEEVLEAITKLKNWTRYAFIPEGVLTQGFHFIRDLMEDVAAQHHIPTIYVQVS